MGWQRRVSPLRLSGSHKERTGTPEELARAPIGRATQHAGLDAAVAHTSDANIRSNLANVIRGQNVGIHGILLVKTTAA